MNKRIRNEYEELLEDIKYEIEALVETMKECTEDANEAYFQAEQFKASAQDTKEDYADELEDKADEDLSDRGATLLQIADEELDLAENMYRYVVLECVGDLEGYYGELEAFLTGLKFIEKSKRRTPRNNTSFKEGRTYYAVSSLAGTDKGQWNKVRVIERTGNKMLVSEFIEHRNLWAEPTTVYVEKTNRGNEVAKFDMFSKLSSMHEAEGVKTKAAPTSQVTLNRRHF